MFEADLDPLTTTNPLDADTDDDGLQDGQEDSSSDGARDLLETDPNAWDTDVDGLSDGQELGLARGVGDTDGNVFAPDLDPLTTTDPLLADTDGGGVPDGTEDQNKDGGVDTWETDPNATIDEEFAAYFSNVIPGKVLRIDVWNARPFETVIPAYSLAGPGPSSTGIGVTLDLTRPIRLIDPFLVDGFGRATVTRLPIPANAPLDMPVWMQAVEVPLGSAHPARVSNPVLLPIGRN